MSEYKIGANQCFSDPFGNVYRPYTINGDVVYKMSLNMLEQNENDEVERLIEAIRERTKIELSKEQLVQSLKEGVVRGDS